MRLSTLGAFVLINIILLQFVRSDKRIRNLNENGDSLVSRKKYSKYNEDLIIKSKHKDDQIRQELPNDINRISRVKENSECRGKKCEVNRSDNSEHDNEERHVKYARNNHRKNEKHNQENKNTHFKKNNFGLNNNNVDNSDEDIPIQKKIKRKFGNEETNEAKVSEIESLRKSRRSDKRESKHCDSDSDNKDTNTGNDDNNSNENDGVEDNDDDDSDKDDNSSKDDNDTIDDEHKEDTSEESVEKINYESDEDSDSYETDEVGKKGIKNGKTINSKRDIVKEKVCKNKKGVGKNEERCDSDSVDSSEESDETDEEIMVPKKKIKYSIKFAHEKEKSRRKKENIDNSIMRIHKSGRKKNKFLDVDDSSEEEDDHFPKKLRLFDDDDDY